MANSSDIPVTGPHEVRPGSPAAQADASPRSSVLGHGEDQDGARRSNGAANGHAYSPRKLIRPALPARAFKDSGSGPRGESPLLAHQTAMTAALADESSHAEAFYFQKQMQMQTLMAFVLEDGEQIEGYIEWYDRHAIKVRNGNRTLIYKSSIKYLYKVGEAFGQ
jgi:sRNA-binding regulator protein Hfq